MKKTKTKSRNGNGAGTLVQDPKSGRYVAWYFDASGRRKKRSTKTTNRRDAERMLATWTEEIAQVRGGLVDADDLRRRDERARPLADHVWDYFGHYVTKPRSRIALGVKASVLQRLVAELRRQLGREPMLEDFTPTRVARAMRARIEEGRSMRTANLLRQNATALAAWLTSEGRANLSDFAARTPSFDESQDRRIIRRALETDELARLFGVARARGRFLWYALAFYAGLRRGELRRVTWGDVDLEAGTIAIRNRKAARIDVLKMHPELVVELRAARPLLAPAAISARRIFRAPVHARTRLRDFEAAGIPRRDDDDRVADLHALRTTLGTELARNGVAIQKAAKVMRHRDPRTTARHYTALGLADVADAISTIPAVAVAVPLAATGTLDAVPADAVSSGSSSGSSRRTKPRVSAGRGGKPSTEGAISTQTQVEIRRDDAGRFEPKRDDVLHSLLRRAFSSAD